jgi:hypothetical protein
MHATELYAVPLKAKSFLLGDVVIPLKQGLLSTVTNLEKLDRKEIRKAATHLGYPRCANALGLVKATAQVEWYHAKGKDAPEMVHHTLRHEIETAMTTTAEAENPPTPEQKAEKKKSRGIRPFVRDLIAQGIHDEIELLTQAKAAFPLNEKFNGTDVRWLLGEAGLRAKKPRKS